MKRKVRAVAKAPRRKSFSKTDLRRAIRTARDVGLPLQKIDIGPDGALSLVIARTSASGDDGMATINEQQLKELI